MCLIKVYKRKPSQVGTGYKAYIKGPRGTVYPWWTWRRERWTWNRGKPKNGMKIGSWLKAKERGILAENNQPYSAGFHIFESERAAYLWGDNFLKPMEGEIPKRRGWGLYKVEYKGAHSLGTNAVQKGEKARTVIAPQMRILKELKK
jgi:hypothetical protein